MRIQTDAIAAAIVAHPVAIAVAAILLGEFAYGFVTEWRRLRALAADLTADMDARSAEIAERMERAFGEEADASYTPARWGEQ